MTFKQWFHRKTGRGWSPNYSGFYSEDLMKAWEQGKKEGLEEARQAFMDFDYDEAYQKVESLKEKV